MRFRFRGPSGAGSIELADNATVGDLISALRAETGSGAITVKYGWPLRTLATDADRGDVRARDLGLQRENLTIVPLEQPAEQPAQRPAAVRPGTAADVDAQLAANLSYGSGEDVKIEMPESRTNLVLRVMPDDGDCMFTAVGGALGGLVPLGASSGANEYTPAALRGIVIDAIRDDPLRFDANFLGATPDRYCTRLREGMWGGGIELSILSEVFRVEICSVDVKTSKAYHFGEQEDYDEFCVVIYSGVHYDRVAEAATEGGIGMIEFDVTRWNTVGNERILRRTQDICKLLRDRHYYTSVSDFVVVCNQCQDILQGEKAIAQHARLTGHSGVTEIAD
ncbi:putative OTU-like cysteine protease [Rosellinia necatrix]|uniref:Ubiquitin thioesterase OTU n=1 Tax=Rosellinia necatrix TaxID=77044 RepID=A0A1W2TXG1_ROSNE|nr:putative OTU-like cysteine protease [Rosellinia necatrix]